MKNHSRGFTLIELMIVVAVVAVLASIAYPSYQESILKGRRADARAALTDLLLQQERYVTANNAYLSFSAGATTVFKAYTGDNLANAAYKIKSDVCQPAGPAIADCVRLTAVPQKPDPKVDEIWVQSSGTKGCTGSDPSRCWK